MQEAHRCGGVLMSVIHYDLSTVTYTQMLRAYLNLTVPWPTITFTVVHLFHTKMWDIILPIPGAFTI